jgi:hypothetical protein
MCCATVAGHRVDLATDQRHHRRPCPGERDMNHAKTRRRLQHLHRHVHRAVVARAAVVVGAGPGFGIGHEVGERLPRRVGAHHQHGGVGGEARDRLELIECESRLAREQLVGLGQHRDRRQRHQQRVAIGRSARGQTHAEAAAGAGLVLDHHRCF